MATVNIFDINNNVVGKLDLPEEIFNYPLNEHLIYEAVKNYNANQRRGTACTKTRAEVAGSGKKLWKQKGLGRARIGSIRSPLWRKGGTTFGPKPRDYSYEMPKKARRNALKSVLSEKLRNNLFYVVNEIKLTEIKTKEAVQKLQKFNYDKMLIVDKKDNRELMLSVRNIANVKAIDVHEINIYDSLKYNYLMFSVDAVKELIEVLK